MANTSRFLQILKKTQKTIKHNASKIGLLNFKRRYSSALYISGKKGNKVFSYLTPYLDFDSRILDVKKLQRDLDLRGYNVDVNEIKKSWEFYKSINAKKCTLEERIMELVQEMKRVSKQKNLIKEDQEELLNKLRTESRVVKQDLKSVKNIIWELDDTIIEKILKLPNEVDQRTPSRTSTILKSFGEFPKFSDKYEESHIDIGRRLGLLEYKNPMQCYLCNDAALFELGVLGYAGKIFNRDDMIRVAGSDFSRSLLVEGSGLNHESPLDAFLIDNHNEVEKESPNRMHLVGGASLISFLAMHAKQLINPNSLPLRYFSIGRQYTPFPMGSTPIGLFTVCQVSAVHAFMIIKDANSDEYKTQFQRLLKTTTELYDNICQHYQIVMRPASELRPWETMRVSFELWSPFSKQYIEVGHISLCGTYFSKRLLIAYQTSTGRDFPAVISGTVLSASRLLGCLLEQNPEQFLIPPKIAENMPVNFVGV